MSSFARKKPNLSALLLAVVLLASVLLASSIWQQAVAVVSHIDTTDFSLKFFRLAAKGAKDNIVVSPYSVQQALSMTLTGAEGKTKSEMQSLLGVAGMSPLAIADAFAKMSSSYGNLSSSTQFQVANAIFANNLIELKQTFVDANQQRFAAKTESLDFAGKAALERINSWVNDKTKGKISSILDVLPPDTALCLINAVYFKSQWNEPFKQADTKEAPFTLLDGKTKPVQLMRKSGNMLYLSNDNFQAVQLSYVDNRFQMYIFLPRKGSDFEAFKASFTTENWRQWLYRFERQEGNLRLPRCNVEYKDDLKELLVSAGMPCAFDKGCADFSGISTTPTCISKVVHKTFLEMNEKGTEAAAATAVVMAPKGAMMGMTERDPFVMDCDHPYLIALRDTSNDCILFIGAIVDPGDK